MNWLISTITFRMRLCSLDDILRLARRCGFAGIELWEPHWANSETDLLSWREQHPAANIQALSGYLDLTGLSAQSGVWQTELKRKVSACTALRIPLLRLFTGTTSGEEANELTWNQFFDRLCIVEREAEAHGLQIAFETHPGTLLDSRTGVERFLAAIADQQWQRIGINFDAFHVWEYGVDPLECIKDWYPFVKHAHLKNASGKTSSFAPSNVFNPAGDLRDLTSLSAGVVNIPELVRFLFKSDYKGAASLEWFGRPDLEFLKGEVEFLNSCLKGYRVDKTPILTSTNGVSLAA